MADIWLSICSKHANGIDPRCGACMTGVWSSSEAMERDRTLFENDYPAWYAQKNAGLQPTPSAWMIWEKITGKTRPQTDG